MDWRDWIIAGAVVTFVGGQIVPAYTRPLDAKKHSHTHVEAEGTHVGSSGVILFSTGASGTRHYVLHAEPGSYAISGGEVELRSA